jgi:peptidase M42 family hydrolase
MEKLQISDDFLKTKLVELLNIASPSGFTHEITTLICSLFNDFGLKYNQTQRGAIRVTLEGRQKTKCRAIVVHMDTLGAMVSMIKENGRLSISPVGKWSSRFAEGARVTINGSLRPLRGTVLPLLASGHIFGDDVDSQKASWDSVEVRIDQKFESIEEIANAGIGVGDFITFDASPEITSTGYINARHLDNKAGIAIVLAVAKCVSDSGIDLPVDCQLVFTNTEEIGTGASAAVDDDVDEMVVIDLAPVGPGQNAIEDGVTICMMDNSGPFDLHVTRKLLDLCKLQGINSARDIYKHYRSDSASAIEAGCDTRTALIGFGVDASHGYERTHISSLMATADLIGCFLQSPL